MLLTLRVLEHSAVEVCARVRAGETMDVTNDGLLIARIVRVDEAVRMPGLQRLIDTGRTTPASRPGLRPHMLAGDGIDEFAKDFVDSHQRERH